MTSKYISCLNKQRNPIFGLKMPVCSPAITAATFLNHTSHLECSVRMVCAFECVIWYHCFSLNVFCNELPQYWVSVICIFSCLYLASTAAGLAASPLCVLSHAKETYVRLTCSGWWWGADVKAGGWWRCNMISNFTQLPIWSWYWPWSAYWWSACWSWFCVCAERKGKKSAGSAVCLEQSQTSCF